MNISKDDPFSLTGVFSGYAQKKQSMFKTCLPLGKYSYTGPTGRNQPFIRMLQILRSQRTARPLFIRHSAFVDHPDIYKLIPSNFHAPAHVRSTRTAILVALIHNGNVGEIIFHFQPAIGSKSICRPYRPEPIVHPDATNFAVPADRAAVACPPFPTSFNLPLTAPNATIRPKMRSTRSLSENSLRPYMEASGSSGPLARAQRIHPGASV